MLEEKKCVDCGAVAVWYSSGSKEKDKYFSMKCDKCHKKAKKEYKITIK